MIGKSNASASPPSASCLGQKDSGLQAKGQLEESPDDFMGEGGRAEKEIRSESTFLQRAGDNRSATKGCCGIYGKIAWNLWDGVTFFDTGADYKLPRWRGAEPRCLDKLKSMKRWIVNGVAIVVALYVI